MTGEDVVLRRLLSRPRAKRPSGPSRATDPGRRQQLGAEMKAEKPQQPGRKSDLKFFDLFVGITFRAQPRALTNRAPVGCSAC